MDNLMEKVFEIKHKLTDQEYLELNNNIMEIYNTKAIIIKEDGNCILTSQQQTNIYNETSEDLEEWEIDEYTIEKDETLL